MSRAPFGERLHAAVVAKGAALCVGLDPDPARVPRHLGAGIVGVRRQLLELIEATAPSAVAFKPNLAFFEQLGTDGWQLLTEVMAQGQAKALVIADAKRGDVGHTAHAYASAIYQTLGADACTVSPYLGWDTLAPFLAWQDRCAFVVCRTSNPGAADLQSLEVGESGDPLYIHVARLATRWAELGGVGLVTGATWPEELARVRQVAPELPFLIPGVGAQGGNLQDAVRAARGPDGGSPYLVSISRAIAQASLGRDFAEAAGLAAREWQLRIKEAEATPASVAS
ncbi:MAG: orotidine-5'-phosphate decarboxylase [Candidatus Dormibacteria bacterium]